jgi:hypothetical protein
MNSEFIELKLTDAEIGFWVDIRLRRLGRGWLAVADLASTPSLRPAGGAAGRAVAHRSGGVAPTRRPSETPGLTRGPGSKPERPHNQLIVSRDRTGCLEVLRTSPSHVCWRESDPIGCRQRQDLGLSAGLQLQRDLVSAHTVWRLKNNTARISKQVTRRSRPVREPHRH